MTVAKRLNRNNNNNNNNYAYLLPEHNSETSVACYYYRPEAIAQVRLFLEAIQGNSLRLLKTLLECNNINEEEISCGRKSA